MPRVAESYPQSRRRQIFQGLVLQQAWDPQLDVEAYIGVVLALAAALVRPAGQHEA